MYCRTGMEACITNLLEPGETVVIGDKGIWGARAADMAGRFGSALPHAPCLTAQKLSAAVVWAAASYGSVPMRRLGCPCDYS